MHAATVAATTETARKPIPFFPYPQVFLSEADHLTRIFRDVGSRGAFILQRELVQFETNLAQFTGAKHAIGVANATDGLLVALRACGIGPGDEVIFPAHTMVATAAAIHFAGALPVPVDCGPDHLIDVRAVSAAITPRTAAILPVHLNGRTADMTSVMQIAKRHGLAVIEDAAQALGSRFRGKCAGTFGQASSISFYPAKLLGCLGDGGAVLTQDDEIAKKVWALHDHGRDQSGEVLGWGLNSRLDNLQAAILDHRLTSYHLAIEKRRVLAGHYHEALSDLSEMVLPPGPDQGSLNGEIGDHFDVYQNYEVEAESRDQLREHLAANGIGTLLPWGGKAVHQWQQLGLTASLPATEQLFKGVLLLPMHVWLSQDEIARISAVIHQFYRSKA